GGGRRRGGKRPRRRPRRGPSRSILGDPGGLGTGVRAGRGPPSSGGAVPYGPGTGTPKGRGWGGRGSVGSATRLLAHVGIQAYRRPRSSPFGNACFAIPTRAGNSGYRAGRSAPNPRRPPSRAGGGGGGRF